MAKGRKENGQFAKGNPGKPKGSINKYNKEIRLFLSELISDNKELLLEDFKSLEPGERIKLTFDLVKFILPKVQPITPRDLMDQEEKHAERWDI